MKSKKHLVVRPKSKRPLVVRPKSKKGQVPKRRKVPMKKAQVAQKKS